MHLADPRNLQVQIATHIADRSSVPDLVEFAGLAHQKGVSRIWINDNLGYRHLFTVLAAIAAETPMGLGTAVAIPYYRNPVDLADAIASLTELTPGRELAVGLGRGSLAQTGVEIDTPAPYRVLAETTGMLRALLSGETVRFGDYAQLAEVFDLNPDARMHLRFEPRAPVRFYLGGYGPTALRTAGEHLDGLLLGGWFLPLLKAGRVDDLVAQASAAAAGVDPEKELRVLAEVNLATARDADRALEFGRTHVSHAIVTLNQQLTAAEMASIGVDPANVDRLEDAFADGATVQEAAEMVTDAMVESFFVVGDADRCIDQLRRYEREYSPPVDQVVFGKLGPDIDHAVATLADEIVPNV